MGRYFTRIGFLHGECFYNGMCEPAEEVERRIRETDAYITNAENPRVSHMGVLEFEVRISPERTNMKFTRITVKPKQMDGVPCIRGLRIPVATVVSMVADRMTEEEILAAFPDLEQEDISEALRYAADAVLERQLPLLSQA